MISSNYLRVKTGVIIQARTDSDRFPNKVLKKIEGKPMLWHVIERCKKMNLPIIVATSNRSIDDSIVEISHMCNVKNFKGSADDVLDRFYHAAKNFSLDLIIRLTADCPLIDPKESIKVVDVLQKGEFDYAGLDGKKYPDGLDTEGFTFETLEKAWKNSDLLSQREHVTPYIKDPNNGFKISIIPSPQDLSKYRWTVDYPDDLEFVKMIYRELNHGKPFYMNDILNLLKKKPHLTKINSSHTRNEGYLTSLRKDEYFSRGQ